MYRTYAPEITNHDALSLPGKKIVNATQQLHFQDSLCYYNILIIIRAARGLYTRRNIKLQ